MAYTYESKCRRCNKINDWFFQYCDMLSYDDFLFAMNSKIQHPRAEECEECEKLTVHDVISYSSKDGDLIN